VLRLRSARPDDAPAVAGVHVRSWQVGYRGLLPDDYLDGLRPADRVARYTFGATDPKLPATIVAIDGEVICGFASTGPSRDPAVKYRGEVFALYVDPPAWGLGVGRRLMAEARARLDRRGFNEAAVWVLVGNDRADHFYRADGWRPDGARRTEDVWGVEADLSRYRRRLP
jgi:GNAT superfamily N-acetyltransferase